MHRRDCCVLWAILALEGLVRHPLAPRVHASVSFGLEAVLRLGIVSCGLSRTVGHDELFLSGSVALCCEEVNGAKKHVAGERAVEAQDREREYPHSTSVSDAVLILEVLHAPHVQRPPCGTLSSQSSSARVGAMEASSSSKVTGNPH